MRLWVALSLLLPLLSGLFAEGQGRDVVWYVSPGGSTNASSCGRTQGDPCASLEVVLSQSELFIVDGGCVSSSGDYDGRLSTTVYFMEGENLVPSLCLSGWTNLRIAGQGGVMVTSSLGGGRGFFEFRNCSNVSIETIHFSSVFVGRTILYIEKSRDITINDCIFPVTSLAGTGVYFESCNGSVTVTNTLFFGDPSLGDESNPAVAMVISQGRNLADYSNDADSNYFQADFFIGNCTFRDIANGGTPNLNYQSAWGSAVGLLGVFYSENNTITVEGCTFTDLKNTVGSSVILRFESGSSDNTARLINTTFLNNTALYGGGVAVYFVSSFVNNLVEIESCEFVNNSATFEGGGIHIVSLSSQSTDLVRLRLRNSTFRNNEADLGAGVFIFNDPSWFSRTFSPNSTSLPLMSIEMEDCVFMNCSASVSEAVVNTLRVKLTMLGDNILTGSRGSAVVLRFSVLVASGTLTFTHNKALNGAALKILERSRVNLIEVTRAVFQFNDVIYSGGAVYADEASTTVTSNEYNHTLSAHVLGVCFMEFRDSFSPLPRSQVIFSNNTAAYGNDMFVYNLRSCMFGNFLPDTIANFLTGPMDYAVVFETDDPLSVISTGPSFLFFYGASTKCYKPVGNVTFLLPNCSHELLMSHFYTLPELQDGLQQVLSELDRFSGPGAQLHPTVDKLILPWSGIETSWSQASSLFDKTSNPGQLLLSPAPGEEFDLTIQMGDQLLNFITATVYVEVSHVPGVSSGVLMQINGVQFAYTDRIYFTPNRVLSGLALVGLIGTEGTLIVGSESQIKGRNILLEIPFKLSQCNLGYYDPVATTREEVDQLILTNYSFTMRIPTNQQLSCICYTRTDVSFDVLGGSLLSECINGYTVELNSLLWAGLLPSDGAQSVDELTTTPCPTASNTTDPNSLDSFSAFLIRERARQNNRPGAQANPAANPTDVAPYLGLITPGGGAPVKCYTGYNMTDLVEFKSNAVFSVDLCTRGFCRADGDWFLSAVTYPCVENRQGPLCGQCKPGLALTVTTTVCKDCSDPMWYIPLLTTLTFGLLLVLFVVVFNLGVFPTLDSMLFFVQAVYVVVSSRIGYRTFQGLGIFNLDFTFDLCITPDLNALQRLLLQYITPLYIMILLSGVVCLTKVKGVSKYLGHHSYLQAMWLIVLVSYLNIANSSFEILHCRFIGPADDTRLVLAYDAAIYCWSGQHLPWAIIAVSLVVFVILPFPLYVGVAIKSSKLKPITDVYTSVYKDNSRYWVVYNIIRRLKLVIISIFTQNFIYRHLYLLLSVLLSLVAIILTWPYRSPFDNYFAASMSMTLVLFMIVTMPTLYTVTDPSRAVSWSIVGIFIAVSIYILILEFILTVYSRRKKIQRITLDKLYTDALRPRIVNSLGKVKLVLWNIKRANAYELEESTRTYISQKASSNFSSYREPLLDSEPVFVESTEETTGDCKQINSITEERNSNSNAVTYSEV